MVFQDKDNESKLCPGISVLENLFLGREGRSKLGILRFRGMEEHARAVFVHNDMSIPPFDAIVGELSGGQQKAVAIGRALLSRPSILLLDEPTASLGVSERKAVHHAIAGLRTAGVGIVLCSHSLEEVMELGDRALALRAGQIITDQPLARLSERDVAMLMSK
jgi:D-xylose transport system ATP-binding protein